ncbi:uncharacterized protein UBRO_02274 [Ustilago bromivora]|nr:uncharacterized protein UBRO_02274 [Ustilago bromivora]
MGASSTARLPSLSAQSIPPLFSHLQHTSNAKVIARWSITIRSFRAVPVPTNAWPSSDQYDTSFARDSFDTDDVSGSNNAYASSSSGSNQISNVGGTSSAAGGSSSSASGAPPLTKPRTMWQVWLSDHPGVVFVIVEDTGRPSRAKAWRDWEVSTKKWKNLKRREIEARRKQQDKTRPEGVKKAEQERDESKDTTTGAQDNTDGSDNKPAAVPTQSAEATGDDAVPMDVDTATTETAAETKSATTSATTSTSTGEVQAGPNPSASAEQATETEQLQQAAEDIIETAGPKPKLRLPSHTRYTVSAVTSSMSAMLTGLNLPPPHGAPAGTAGPGAWVPRGAAVSIEGLVLEINSQNLNALPGISPALASVSSIDDTTTVSRSNGTGRSAANGSGGVDWRVRVGSVTGGGGRSAGAIVEAEFLPVSTLLPTSRLMHDFLHSLFPPGLVPMPPPAPTSVPGMLNQDGLRVSGGLSQAVSATGTPRAMNATLGSAAGMNGDGAVAGPAGRGSGFSYTIGGGAGAGAAPPNRHFNIPVVSDQLWEEVVPRSGEGWRQRIAKRSYQLRQAARQQRRQRKNATQNRDQDSSAAAKKHNGTEDAYAWHAFGSDDDAEAHTNRDWQDENEDDLSSSGSEAEQATPNSTAGASAGGLLGGLLGTAVTVQQADEDDDDDDDDCPLGVPIWSNANRNSAAPNSANPLSGTPATAPESVQTKKEDTVQLIFQGLRPDQGSESAAEADGWTGIERGRRIAFQYVQMLRAEGII